MKKNKILFAISSLGLGHATRTLPIIKYFLEKNYSINIISFGNALNFLKKELKSKKVNFFEIKDYPAIERGKGIMFYFYLIIDLFKTKIIIKQENNFVAKIAKNYDFIISDGRYGVYNKNIPSFLISHQLSFVMPKGLGFFNFFADLENIKYFKNFNKILIPDYEDKNNNLAGKLSHPKWIKKINYEYIGILSDFKKDNKQKQDIDYLFTITGYLQEHKKDFVENLIEQSKKIEGKKVFVLGDTSKKYIKKLDNNIELYSYVSGELKNSLFNRAKTIISRTGYTTIMDLQELQKKAILFPTPNQTEQEYLAKYFKEKKYFVIGEKKSNLLELIEKSKNLGLINFGDKTKDSLKKIEKIINL